ncbi:MAG: argininosuccinate lyase [Thermoplasmata archaeon]|nr:argininosuccinate lyase [Thermoplasmata archaeon]
MLRDRFSAPLDPRAAALSVSVAEDRALLGADLWGSVVHAQMLGATGIVPRRSASRIVVGLRAIARDAAAGKFPLDPALEDVHLNVEAELTRRIGPDGERLHTARSRNDQVATDLAISLRESLLGLERSAATVAGTLVGAARSPDGRHVVDGWTHTQPAQRVYWGQILGSHALRFVRDAERFRRVRERIEASPLGSGAIAGTSLPVDRTATARALGFRRPSVSSIDAVSDRDAASDALYASAVALLHASGFAEELVLGSLPGVDRVRLGDPFVTTSSLMPHKRNPDLAELVRAESAPAIGRLVSHLALLKGLPMGYHRDLQVGKPLVLEGLSRARLSLDVLGAMARGSSFLSPPATDAATGSVEVADALVRAGVPFRSAHRRVGLWLARRATEKSRNAPIGTAELRAEFPELPDDFRFPGAWEEPERRGSAGGSSWRSVDRLLAEVDARRRSGERAAATELVRLQKLRRTAGVPERLFRPAEDP